MPRTRKKKLGETLRYHMKQKGLSATQLARMLTDAGVPTDKRKVMKWREIVDNRTVHEDAAVALDKVFGTINVFGQYVYRPQLRGTRAALADPIAVYVSEQQKLREEVDDLKRRVLRLERSA